MQFTLRLFVYVSPVPWSLRRCDGIIHHSACIPGNCCSEQQVSLESSHEIWMSHSQLGRGICWGERGWRVRWWGAGVGERESLALMTVIWLLQQPDDHVQTGTHVFCFFLMATLMIIYWALLLLARMGTESYIVWGHLRSKCTLTENKHYVSLGKWTYMV